MHSFDEHELQRTVLGRFEQVIALPVDDFETSNRSPLM